MGDQHEVAPVTSGHEVSQTSSAPDAVPRTIPNETPAPDAVRRRISNETSARNPVPQTITTETPDPDLIRLEQFMQMTRELHRAAMEGDWEAAKKIIDENAAKKIIDENGDTDLDLISLKVDGMGRTALHVAANCGKTAFVVEMVKILSEEQVKVSDIENRNVLHHVAIASGVGAAKAIVDKWPCMTQEKNQYGKTPLHDAARWRHPSKAKKMVEYLHSKTNDDVYHPDSEAARDLIVAVTNSGCLHVALEILEKHPKLAVAKNFRGWSILHVLASQPSAFPRETNVSLWKKTWIGLISEKQNDAIQLVHVVCKELQKKDYSFVKDYFMMSSHNEIPPTLHVAIENGVFELVVLCLKYFPEIIWYTRNDWEFALHVAVKHRQVELFNHMINLFGSNFGVYYRPIPDQSNILHLAAALAPTPQLHSIAGPAFQLQRELQWFKAVESLVSYEQIDAKNKDGHKPIDLFYEQHKDLIKDAKQWITTTSNSCMVVAALVATVAFASMITVPGGNDSGTGKPILSKSEVFIVFSISNACSMISSAIALLMFLSLQTSRFTTEDFLATVPKNLLRGLLSLFFVVATMMIAFGTAIGMAIQTSFKWAYIPTIIVACIPTIIFTKLQLPLLFQTIGVTSGPSLLPKQKKHRKGKRITERDRYSKRPFDNIISRRCIV